MSSKNSDEKNITLQKTKAENPMCPFAEPRGQKLGNVLVASMCIILPSLILVLLLLSRM